MAIATINSVAWANLASASGAAKAAIASINGQSAPAGGSYVFSDDLEYANAAAAASAGWTDAGTPTWAYTTSPAPLQGTYSCLSNAAANSSYYDFTATDPVGIYFMFSVSAISTTPHLCRFYNSTTELFRVRALSTGAIRIYTGGGTTLATSSSAGLVANDTVYHLWIEATAGGGTNGSLAVSISTTPTKPPSPDVSSLASTHTLGLSRFYIAVGVNSCNLIADKIRVASSAIGSNPT